MNTKTIIHSPYEAYNCKKDKWEWVVEVYKQELIIYTFKTEEEAQEFKRDKLNESK